jgi:hypothetical protein
MTEAMFLFSQSKSSGKTNVKRVAMGLCDWRSRQCGRFWRVRRARMMLVQIDRQLQAQLLVGANGKLEKFLLNAAREMRPKAESSMSDGGLKS